MLTSILDFQKCQTPAKNGRQNIRLIKIQKLIHVHIEEDFAFIMINIHLIEMMLIRHINMSFTHLEH